MSSDPVLIAYGVKRRSTSKRAHWTRIEAAYPHDSGAGLTVILDLLPLDGRIVLLEPDSNDDRRLQAEAARRAKEKSKPRKEQA